MQKLASFLETQPETLIISIFHTNGRTTHRPAEMEGEGWIRQQFNKRMLKNLWSF